MSNDYYENTVSLTPYTKAKAEDIDGDLDSIEAGFEKLPDPHADAPTTKGFSEAFVVIDGTNEAHVAPISQIRDAVFYGTCTGSANAYAVTLTPAPSAYTTGMTILFKPSATNTGASTVNVNSLGIKSIKSTYGAATAANELYTTDYALMTYDGTNFVLQNPRATTTATLVPAPPAGVDMVGGISGLILSNSTDTDHDISVSAGACMDSTGAYYISLSSAMVKQIDAAWAVGTNAGGLLNGSVGASELYHVYALRKDSDASVDIGFLDQDDTLATYLPTGYSSYRWLGFVLTDASSNIRNFKHLAGDKIVLKYAYEISTNLQVATYGLVGGHIDLSSIAPTGRTESVTIGANDGSTYIQAGNSTEEPQIHLDTAAGAAWTDILASNVAAPSIGEVAVNRSGGIEISTNNVSVDIWLKAVKIIR